MKDLNLIAPLISIDKRKLTENAFCLEDNKKRYLPPTQGVEKGPTISSQEATPAQEQPKDDHCKHDSTHMPRLLPIGYYESFLGLSVWRAKFAFLLSYPHL